jgi:hypothetical protein
MAATNVQAFSGDVEITSNLAVNTDDLFVDTVNSRVGIGMTTPEHELHVKGSGGTRIGVESTSGYGGLEIGGANGGLIDFKTPFSDDNDVRIIYNGSDLRLTGADVNINEALHVTGSVGIGTMNPDEALHVAGNIRLGAAEGVDDDNFKSIVTTSPLEVHSNAEDLDGLGVSLNLRSGFSDSESNIQMLSSKSNSTFQYISFATATQERMRITSAGRVGIGKTDPGTALDVVGDITASSMFIDDFIYHTNDTHTYFGFNEGDHFQIVEAGGVRFQVDSNGRVGIGVEAPAQLLDVAGRIRADTMEMDSYIYHVGDTNTYFGFNGASQFRITEGTTVALQVNDDSTIDIQNYIRHAGNTNTYMGFNANNQIVMRTNGTDRITVKSDGDVGIGTDSPATQLEIRGQTTSSIPTIRLTNTAPGNDIQDLGGLEVYSVDGGGDFCGSMIVRRDNTGASPDGNIVFRCGQNGVSSDRMIIKENGRVGIGTATPNASLDVNGSIKSRLPWLWARNTTYYTTNIASHLLTFPSVIDRDTGAGNMHAGAYKTVAFPLTGTYVVYVAGHSVFGASHISYFRGTLYNSSNGAREAFYSQSSQSVGANHDNFAGTTFVVHANSGDYMNITHDTTVANQRNYSGSHQIIVATMISGTY